MNSSIIDKRNKDNNASPNENDNLLEEILTTGMKNVFRLKRLNIINTSTHNHIGLPKALLLDQ